MIAQDKITLNRGGDLNVVCRWLSRTNGVTTPVDLTGETFTPFEVEPNILATGMTITVINGPEGRFTIERSWDDDWPGSLGAVVSFRAVSASGTYTIPRIQVLLK